MFDVYKMVVTYTHVYFYFSLLILCWISLVFMFLGKRKKEMCYLVIISLDLFSYIKLLQVLSSNGYKVQLNDALIAPEYNCMMHSNLKCYRYQSNHSPINKFLFFLINRGFLHEDLKGIEILIFSGICFNHI